MSEMIDIYAADGTKTGDTQERGSFLAPGSYMLYVLAMIEDGSGRFLITQRAQDKKWAAGWWEVTGGGVRAGETSLQAIKRESMEETGLDIAQSTRPLAPVFHYRNDDPDRGDNYLVDIYHVALPFTLADVKLQQREATGARLATRDEIRALADEGIFLHYRRLEQALAAEAARQA